MDHDACVSFLLTTAIVGSLFIGGIAVALYWDSHTCAAHSNATGVAHSWGALHGCTLSVDGNNTKKAGV